LSSQLERCLLLEETPLPKRSRSFLGRAPKRSHPTFLYGNQWFRVTPSFLASEVYRAAKPALAPREEPRRAMPSRVTRIRHKTACAPPSAGPLDLFRFAAFSALDCNRFMRRGHGLTQARFGKKICQSNFSLSRTLVLPTTSSAFHRSSAKVPSPALQRDLGIHSQHLLRVFLTCHFFSKVVYLFTCIITLVQAYYNCRN
jgi:hypothetical protein